MVAQHAFFMRDKRKYCGDCSAITKLSQRDQRHDEKLSFCMFEFVHQCIDCPLVTELRQDIHGKHRKKYP